MNKWILVRERLPEKAGRYLCTARWDKDSDYRNLSEWRVDALEYGIVAPSAPIRIKDRCFGEYAFGELWDNGIDNVEEVIAWMPLPEPYQVEDEKSGE